jgi:hypothetical protein
MKKIVLGFIEDVEIYGKNFKARIDSGAYMNSIDKNLVKKLGLGLSGDKIKIRSANGRMERDLVNITFKISGKELTDSFSVADRTHMTYKILIGRSSLIKNFVVDGKKNG